MSSPRLNFFPFSLSVIHGIASFLIFLSLFVFFFFSTDLCFFEGCWGWGAMMYGSSGYSYLLSYGKAVAALSQAVIELLALLSLSFCNSHTVTVLTAVLFCQLVRFGPC